MQFILDHGAQIVALISSLWAIASELIPLLSKGDIGGVIHLIGVLSGAAQTYSAQVPPGTPKS